MILTSVTNTGTAGPRPAAASAGGRTVAGWPGLQRLDFSTTDPLRAREFLDQVYGWRIRVIGARDLRTALTVTHVDTGSFAVSDVTLPADLMFEVTGWDALIVSTIIEGTARVDRAGGTDHYRPGDVLIGNFPLTRFFCQTHSVRCHNVVLPVSLLYAVAGLEAAPSDPLRFLSPHPASPPALTQWGNACDYADSLLADSEAASPLVISIAARLLAATALTVFPNTAADGPG